MSPYKAEYAGKEFITQIPTARLAFALDTVQLLKRICALELIIALPAVSPNSILPLLLNARTEPLGLNEWHWSVWVSISCRSLGNRVAASAHIFLTISFNSAGKNGF